jgi:hypothetical protein
VIKDISKIMMWHVWKVTYLRMNVTIVCGMSYHLLGSQISQDSKIRFQLQVESYISDWWFSKLQHLVRYVSRHNAMAYDTYMRPHIFWHRTRGFLEARRSWEPGSSLFTGEFSPFCLFAKGFWCEHPLDWMQIIPFLLTKILKLTLPCGNLGLAKLYSTAWVWNRQGISKLVNKVDCRLSYDSFLTLHSRQ